MCYTLIPYENTTCDVVAWLENWGLRFESSVISYGNQTKCECGNTKTVFESSVISYGNQTGY